ncbi:uncharacterized protein TRAVEDRAFT_53472 [Trametes versicolor FP-101664 SS1]|uniref:uncharacterized protein n=1 Tax=Trametes versicolor (strain FP-101664) TaxID=717944 RepID=UPI0004622DB5|nr:uncharacterized protein TRAVEDRAFT_53472 [Trametes versicolor FP-101664 SS1]EIW53055.1 hypothetical protein TRAVEDRAFT_53472 [Trametes versicolor FP-101664 SS1]
MAIQAAVQDDVESFYWVLLYAVLRNLAANMGVPVGPTASSSLLGKRVPAENISHAPWVLLWRYNRHLRDTDVEDEMPTLEADVSGEDGLEDGSDTEVVARVLNHDKLMNNLRVAAAGGLLTDEMSAGG